MAGVGPTEGLPVPAPVQGGGSRGAGEGLRGRRGGRASYSCRKPRPCSSRPRGSGLGAEPGLGLVLTAPPPPLILILRATTPLPGCVPQGARAS